VDTRAAVSKCRLELDEANATEIAVLTYRLVDAFESPRVS